MDLREFALFLKNKILEKANTYNEELFAVSYKNLEDGKYIAGQRLALVAIANSMGNLLKEFCERN